jgi:hypothetical protein
MMISRRSWSVVGSPKPEDRPKIEDVLLRLKAVSGFWTPLSSRVITRNSSDPDTEGGTEEDDVSSLFHAAPSLPLHTLLPKGEIHDKIPGPTLPLTRLQLRLTRLQIIRTSGHM